VEKNNERSMPLSVLQVVVPRENHQKNNRSLIEKSEFVPQMKAIIV
jgi:hypothetical protein